MHKVKRCPVADTVNEVQGEEFHRHPPSSNHFESRGSTKKMRRPAVPRFPFCLAFLASCSLLLPSVHANVVRETDPSCNILDSSQTASEACPKDFHIIRSSAPCWSNNATDVQALLVTQWTLAHTDADTCKTTRSLTILDDTVVGVYGGSSVSPKVLADSVVQRLIGEIIDNGGADSVYVESCSTSPSSSNGNVGIVIGKYSSLPTVQSALTRWAHGGCMTTATTQNSTAVPWTTIQLALAGRATVSDNSAVPPSADLGSDGTADASHTVSPVAHTERRAPKKQRRRLLSRADCSSIQVRSGDSCASLAERCNVSGNDLTKYNDSPTLCSSLMPGQHICCSAGSLPDLRPKSQSDGTCATYMVVKDDTCSSISSANSIHTEDIIQWNRNTWQFSGCNNIQIGQILCISNGSPPMPAPVTNAVCGPQVPGTIRPGNMSIPGALASLNPCSLNACCDIWGQCGATAEFCTPSQSESGAPGTAAPGKNGCISNCGTDIVSSNAPDKWLAVGYYEGFNQQRPCATMEVSQIPSYAYTHIHFAFATLSRNFEVFVDSASSSQWSDFKKLNGPKRILSVGGWTFSNDPATYDIFRNAVKPENRNAFARNVAAFITQDVDGVDFDWEYPGAPDLPGTGFPSGSPDDGQNYLRFLQELRFLLPAEKSISVAVPASYWYLRGFPIAEISKVVDYIVYMTYDLHGQWDHGNKYSTDGCPAGNCLRSQVNSTETHVALSLITKAGVPSNKIVVGVTSYGRAFQMTQAGCTGPMCTYTGPESGATPGECTKTAGYLAQVEIDNILAENPSARTFYDAESQSDILVYNATQWVSYMAPETKTTRVSAYLSWRFLGSAEWAIDLASPGPPSALQDSESVDPLPDCLDASRYPTVDHVVNDTGIPEFCVNTYLMYALSETMLKALSDYKDIMRDGYESKYAAYAREVRSTGYWSWQKVWTSKEFWNCYQTDDGRNHTVDCSASPQGQGFYFELKSPDTFCKELSDKYNLDCAWIKQVKITYVRSTSSIACVRFGACGRGGDMFFPELDGQFPVSNPADVISKSLEGYEGVADWLSESAFRSQVNLFLPLDSEGVDGSSIMVSTVAAAVEAVKQVAEAGEKAAAEQKKRTILAFIEAILLIIPGIGEIAEAAVMLAQVARVARLADLAGQTALGLYQAVDNPGDAPMAAAGILLGGLAVRSEFSWARAASKNRALKQDVIKSMGDRVAANMDKIKKTCKACAS